MEIIPAPVSERRAVSRRQIEAPMRAGASAPLGATPVDDGVNFSLFSKRAVAIDLLLFEGAEDGKPTRTIRLNPVANRTYHYWHVFVPGVKPGQIALAWLLHKGTDIVPIPGTKRRKNLEENVAALGIALTHEDLQRIDEAAPKGAASGERYEDMTAVNR